MAAGFGLAPEQVAWGHSAPVQSLYGQPVLTWFQGTTNHGTGEGHGVILNQNYQQIAAVNAGQIFKYLTKPADLKTLRETLTAALDQFVGQAEKETLLQEKVGLS